MTLPTQLSWFGIVRLGLVQAMLGAVVVLTTSTLNRVMVVELALPALLPGLLIALHYAVQLSRPRMGYGADAGRRRTPWILGGQGVLATGGFLAAVATAWMGELLVLGQGLAVLAFVLVGLGVSAAGTNLLTLLAKQVQPARRAAAAATVWIMMIVGFALTAGIVGKLLDPYSPARLVMLSGGVSLVAVLVTLIALWRLESRGQVDAAVAVPSAAGAMEPMTASSFMLALREVWAEHNARRFTIFVFMSMIAYSAQDLILEPMAGQMFGYSPGESTQLSGVQHGGSLAGMLLATLAGRRLLGLSFGSPRTWVIAGCLGSAAALVGLGLAASGTLPGWPLKANVFLLGVANGAFAIAAIASMMALAGQGGGGREGTRVGLWGAAQAIGFAGGGLIGAAGADVVRWWTASAASAYGSVFVAEALLFVVAAGVAARVAMPATLAPHLAPPLDAAAMPAGANP